MLPLSPLFDILLILTIRTQLLVAALIEIFTSASLFLLEISGNNL